MMLRTPRRGRGRALRDDRQVAPLRGSVVNDGTNASNSMVSTDQILSEVAAVAATARPCHLIPLTLFTAWNGVIALVFEGWPESLVEVKRALDGVAESRGLKFESLCAATPKPRCAHTSAASLGSSKPWQQRLGDPPSHHHPRTTLLAPPPVHQHTCTTTIATPILATPILAIGVLTQLPSHHHPPTFVAPTLLRFVLRRAPPVAPPRRSGSRWPKATLAALREDAPALSGAQLKTLKALCREHGEALAGYARAVRISSLSLVRYEWRSLERIRARAEVAFRGTPEPTHAETHSASSKSSFWSFLGQWHRLLSFVPLLSSSGRIGSYRAQSPGGSTVVAFFTPPAQATPPQPRNGELPRSEDIAPSLAPSLATADDEPRAEALLISLRAFRDAVDSALPGMYSWLEEDSLHCTLRALDVTDAAVSAREEEALSAAETQALVERREACEQRGARSRRLGSPRRLGAARRRLRSPRALAARPHTEAEAETEAGTQLGTQLGTQPATQPATHLFAAASSSNNPEEDWHDEWQDRLECWWVGLPGPTQSQLSNCFGALGLHLGARLDASLRAAHPLRAAGGGGPVGGPLGGPLGGPMPLKEKASLAVSSPIRRHMPHSHSPYA